jgi:tRNA(Arg) A34 adenosine deaminase TadA
MNAMNNMENYSDRQREFMRQAIELSRRSVESGGGPFGAVIVRGGEVIATGSNSVTLLNDPTAHAEVSAIRRACADAGVFDLSGCEMYSSCEPCPMCLSALYWAGIDCLYYANTRRDAADIGFDDSFIYDQIPLAPEKRSIPVLPMTGMHPESIEVFRAWDAKTDKVEYETTGQVTIKRMWGDSESPHILFVPSLFL